MARLVKNTSLLALLLMLALPFSWSAAAAPDKPKKIIEMETIEIKGKIQEPTLLYILDQPSFEIETYEETMDFLKKISEPVEENQL